jgi:7,8-dihydroneopterin aldolase/epimerase/oxygenase
MNRTRKIYIKKWIVNAGIGIHPHEQNKKQPLRINITFFQNDIVPFVSKKITDVVDYEAHKNNIQSLIDAQHEALIETLAERIAQSCMNDPLITHMIVDLEKLQILPGLESCGVEIERWPSDYTKP